MLSKEENEMLTRLGPGTPCGELMRRYWHPVAATVQLEDNPKYGFTKGMRDSDDPEDVWQLGGPVFFPYLVYPNGGNSGSMRHDYQIGVPIDDTTTWHFSYRSYTFLPEVTIPRQERIPYVEVPIQDANGAKYPKLGGSTLRTM